MFKYFNPNYKANHGVGDCSVRAVAKALNISWDTAYALITAKGFELGNMPSGNEVWGAVLRDNGFHREIIPNVCPDCYSVQDFAKDNPIGTYIVGTDGHVVTIVDGDWYDTWNSQDVVPLYFWTR